MKKASSFIILSILLCYQAFAQVSDKNISLSSYKELAASDNPKDKEALELKLYSLLKSQQEADWIIAEQFFFKIKRNKVVDSLTKIHLLKFPNGTLALNKAFEIIYNEQDPAKKEKFYRALVKRIPPSTADTAHNIYEILLNNIATAYANYNDVDKALQFANMSKIDVWKTTAWGSVAPILLANGHVKSAEVLYKKASDNAYNYLTIRSGDPYATFGSRGFTDFSTSLAHIYFTHKRYKEALKYIREAYANSKTISGLLYTTYAQVLDAVGKDEEAFDIIDEAVKAGQTSPEMEQILQSVWVKVKGTNAGYEEYLGSSHKILVEKIRKDVAKQMINVPAADFTLTDVNGHRVSLHDLKGKTVILDFWATWCGPCKKSFPSMKMAVQKFKYNPDVKFIFIHTWERQEYATDSAKAYIDRNNYPFEVLMDLRNADGINPVVESYKVQGIPAKFVIDKEGHIRFRFSGFSDGDDMAVEEISAMIELTNKQN
jgi:thiol-disulfide isomerase/thioredoxin